MTIKQIGNFTILRKVGAGSTSTVYLAKDRRSNKDVALKVIKPDLNRSYFLNEIDTHKRMIYSRQNNNIINLIEAGEEHFVKETKSQQVVYMAFELALGDMADILSRYGELPEEIARYFFIQVLNGLKECHDAKVYHRDIKLENILVTEELSAKLTDFGFSCSQSEEEQGFLTTYVGTISYMAPEIFMKLPYQGEKVDIFALGVTLFMMAISKLGPFVHATNTDKLYKAIAANREDVFWKFYPKKDLQVSDELKQLVIWMLNVAPPSRPSLEEISQHPWLQGTVPSSAQVAQWFTLQDQQQREMTEKVQAQGFMLSEDSVPKEITMRKSSDSRESRKQLYEYYPQLALKCLFFSTYPAENVERLLIDFIEKKWKQKLTPNEKKYKIKFNVMGGSGEHGKVPTCFCIRFLKVPKSEKIGLEFTMHSGDNRKFKQLCSLLKTQFSYLANATV